MARIPDQLIERLKSDIRDAGEQIRRALAEKGYAPR
jgi:hypothetical protein